MNKRLSSEQYGFAHLGVILVVAVVIGIISFAGIRVMRGEGESVGNQALGTAEQIAANKKCMARRSDADLCKFLSSADLNDKLKIESTSIADGKTIKSTTTYDGSNSSTTSDDRSAMDTIIIGNATYTKSLDTWWKETTTQTNEPEPSPAEDTPAEDISTYKKLGKEACGKLTCFKYQLVDTEDSKSSNIIWFDTKDYLCRRILIRSADGSINETIVSYNSDPVTAPSPVKELGKNQYVMPGESKPRTREHVPAETEDQ